MPKPTGPTVSSVISQVAAQLTEPISFDEFAQRVLAIRPSTAKDPKAGIRNELVYHLLDHHLVYLDNRKQMLAPLKAVMQGIRFRHVISEAEAASRLLLLDSNLATFLPGRGGDPTKTILTASLLDEVGKSLPVRLGSIREEITSFFDQQPHTVQRLGLQLTEWFLQNGVTAGDAVLFTIEAWEPPRWRLLHEPAAQRKAAAIAERNAELVEILFAMLEAAQNENILQHEALLSAHARLSEPTGYPGDPWLEALAQDGRMLPDGWRIGYADGHANIFDLLLRGTVAEEAEPVELSQAEGQQVYRFKAEFTHRKSIWRRIEILGEQTLSDLNTCLVRAFQHDWDHMGGFWRRIRRGASKRFREVELGTVAPFAGEGENEDLQIAAIGLQPGDEIKYVYDFGDSHQHLLTLEEILPGPPPAEVESMGKPRQKQDEPSYPRVIEQNKPRYQHCQECKKKGKETVAKWFCHQCSQREQREMVYCNKCVGKFHEEHYTVELVY
jgi:hypothetical protein